MPNAVPRRQPARAHTSMRVCQCANTSACWFTLQRRRRVTQRSASLPKSSPSTFQRLFLPCSRWSTITKSARVVVVTTAPIKKKSTSGPTVWYAQHADESFVRFFCRRYLVAWYYLKVLLLSSTCSFNINEHSFWLCAGSCVREWVSLRSQCQNSWCARQRCKAIMTVVVSDIPTD